MFRLTMACLVLVAAALAGCAGKPLQRAPGDAGGGPRGEVELPGPMVSPLAGEQRWMEQLFDGTPVVVQGEPDGAVVVEVPVAHAFDAQLAAPKPPMRAVLDKITLSMLRQPRAQLQIGPPGPAARERLAALRSHILGKGIASPRLAATAPRQSDMVLLRLLPPPSTREAPAAAAGGQATSSDANSGSALVRGR
jgi:hypothetical protein